MRSAILIGIAMIVALIGLITLQSGSLDVVQQAGIEEFKEYSIDDFLDNIGYWFIGSFSHDGSKVIVSHDRSGIHNAYSYDIRTGEEKRLTSSSTNRVFASSYFPNDDRYIFTMDEGGNELDHVYVRELDGSVFDLTPGPGHRASFQRWAADGKSFYVRTNERDPRFFDVYEYSIETYDRKMIFENNDGYSVGSATAKERYRILNKSNSNSDSDVFLYDHESGNIREISYGDEDAIFIGDEFTPDGEKVIYLTDRDSEFQYVMSYDIETGEHSLVFQHNWDVWDTRYSSTGKYLLIRTRADARRDIVLLDGRTFERIEFPKLQGVDIIEAKFSPNDDAMIYRASNHSMPGDLLYVELSASVSTDTVRQLTRSLNQNIEPQHLVEGQLVRFESFDGLEIPGILYMPHEARPTNKVPALVWIHGGPGGQSAIFYNGMIQYLVNHGYAIYAINNRGSSGYGKTFYHLDDLRHGQDDLDDVIWSKKMLIDTDLIDPERIGVFGGSYGGYLVLAALTFSPEEFAVGIDMYGISNWLRTLQSIPPYFEDAKKYLETEIGPTEDEEFLRAKSPLFHADQITKPLMVIQGANDVRVIKEESDDIVEAARANGVPVEYLVFEDEGHGIFKRNNKVVMYEAILKFLKDYL